MKTLNLFNTILLLITFSFLATSTTAQEIWQVDSRIEKMTVTQSGGYYILHINVKANNDDDARSPKLIVNLPRNCRVRGITMPDGFENTAYQIYGIDSQVSLPNSKPPNIDSYIKFDLRNLGTTTDINFKISFEPSVNGLRPKSAASAFIYTITPEANKSNNFKTIAIN